MTVYVFVKAYFFCIYCLYKNFYVKLLFPSKSERCETILWMYKIVQYFGYPTINLFFIYSNQPSSLWEFWLYVISKNVKIIPIFDDFFFTKWVVFYLLSCKNRADKLWLLHEMFALSSWTNLSKQFRLLSCCFFRF